MLNHQAEYQLSFEDFKEAIEGINASAQKRSVLGGRRSVFGWVLFIALAVMLFMLLNKTPSSAPAPVPPRATEPWRVLVPLLPWVLIFGVIWIFVFRQLRGPKRTTWEQTAMLHGVRSITIDEDGLSLVEPTSQSRLSWDHFIRFAETKNLFLLFDTDYSAEVIPKRIFRTPGEEEEFRGLLTRSVSPPTGAFPVLPAASQPTPRT